MIIRKVSIKSSYKGGVSLPSNGGREQSGFPDFMIAPIKYHGTPK